MSVLKALAPLLLFYGAIALHPAGLRADVADCVAGQLRAAVAARPAENPDDSGLIALCRKNRIPVFLKETSDGRDLPVILLNARTYPALKDFISDSMATQVHLQPDWKNDHGGLRMMNTLIDVDTPGARGFGEINQTGLSWKHVDSYLKRRAPDSDVIIEIAYRLNATQKKEIEYYQRVRRAALIRVPFTFGADGTPDAPNMLLTAGEHCFLFCKGSTLNNQVSEIKRDLNQMGIADVDAFMKSEQVGKFLALAKSRILSADPGRLSPDMLSTGKELKIALDRIAPDGIRENQGIFRNFRRKKGQLGVFANWVVGLDAAQNYQDLLNQLRISSDNGFQDIQNRATTAVLVYDSQEASKAFDDATYESRGAMFQWTRDRQLPVPRPAPTGH